MVSPSKKKGNHSPHTTTTVYKTVEPEEVPPPPKGTLGSLLGCQSVPPCSSAAMAGSPLRGMATTAGTSNSRENSGTEQQEDPNSSPPIPSRAATSDDENGNNDDGSESIWTSLISKLRPGACFADTTLPDDTNDGNASKFVMAELQKEVPTLIEQVQVTSSEDIQKSKKRKDPQQDALQRLYKLTDLEHKANRVPIMSNTDWNVADHLAFVISNKATSSESRRLACLTLNNLSIPFENKYKMAMDTKLMERLLMVIRNFSSETYLCCICLFNMSFEETAKVPLLEYPKLILSLEQLLVTYTPILLSQQEEEMSKNVDGVGRDKDGDGSSRIGSGNNIKKPQQQQLRISRTQSQGSGMTVKTSIEGEAVRWTLGLLRNLTTMEDGCLALSKTQIISEIIKLVSGVAPPHCEYWQRDSMEDFALQTLTHLAQHTPSLNVLKRDAAHDAIGHLMGQGGIHDFRASMITAKMNESTHCYSKEMKRLV